MNVTAIVLAAGTSRRMGQQNKLLLPWGSSTILETVLQNILASNASVIVVTGHENERVEQQVKGMELQLVYNGSFLNGMTSTIQTGVREVPLDHGMLICPGDMPLLTASDYNSLIGFAAGKCIIVPEYNGQRGNPVFFSSHFRDQLLAHAEPEGCKGVVLANEQYVILVDGSERNVFDIDSLEDL